MNSVSSNPFETNASANTNATSKALQEIIIVLSKSITEITVLKVLKIHMYSIEVRKKLLELHQIF
jgi:hypothetical protein